MKDETKLSAGKREERAQAPSWTLEEAWENCTGQCGADPWCRVCLKEKNRLHEEELNRKARTDDKE